MADGRTPKLTSGESLIKTVFLARRLRSRWNGQRMVGILLPPSIPGALINWAALLLGKVPINLNYTTSNESLASCAKQCELKTVVTSKLFLEKVHVQPPGEIIYVEDLAENPRLSEKLTALLAARLFPARLLELFLGVRRTASLDDTATIIFSSGSTGEPKGVMLAHFNLVSNVEQLEQVFHLHEGDRILGILPFFHSFGFTGTLCILEFLCAALSPGGVWQFAHRPGRRRKIAGAGGAGIRRSLRYSPLGRIWLHGMLAGGGGKHLRFPRRVFSPDRREARHHRPPAARNRGAHH
jgi:acyl-CoA synthetase (AMP-forming)/AMP-acid ligase II